MSEPTPAERIDALGERVGDTAADVAHERWVALQPLLDYRLLRVGDVYSDLWRRPELDPTYGQTALSTYQELLNRYPNSAASSRARGSSAR